MAENYVFNREESSKFPRTADSDVVIQSSDGVEFHLHKKYLEFGTGAFPTADMPTNDEIVSLPESKATLEILFQFIYPRRCPSIEHLNFDALILLAEAAEKYEVFVVIYACQIRLKAFVRTNSKSLLAFAAKHDYFEIIIELAPVMIDTPVQEVADVLPAHIFRPWCLYRERWTSAVLTAVSSLPTHRCGGMGGMSNCGWSGCASEVARKLAKPSNLRLVNEMFQPFTNFCYANEVAHWKQSIEWAVNVIQPMSLESLSTT